ncbi:MAG: phenylacetate--CoA ligase family protein, partial [Clostridia bacterium]
YGPGIAINCEHNTGMHYFDDYLYFEIIDPKTGEVLPDGELGELVITTLEKEGAPLIRYRTHDLTRIIPDTTPCPCGRSYPRIDVILGRTDDMVKVKGVNIYPGQIDDLLKELPNASSEYKVEIDHENGKDRITVFVETALSGEEEKAAFEKEMKNLFKTRINVTIQPKAAAIGELPRSEKKSTRIFDYRY